MVRLGLVVSLAAFQFVLVTVAAGAADDRQPTLHFSDDYKATHEGLASFEVPEGFELSNIILALTDYGIKNPNRIYKDTPYYQAVMEHFGPFKDHPMVKWLNKRMEEQGAFDTYLSFRENGTSYQMIGGKLTPTGVHNGSWTGDDGKDWMNLFRDNLEMAEDFAKNSGFEAFFDSHKDYYDELTADYYQLVDLAGMKAWLEQRFPETNYNELRVIFSPLVKATHSADRKEDNGFRQALMFVAHPFYRGDLSDPLAPAKMSRLVFTEIDHNYVNPVSDKFLAEIDAALADLEAWNGQERYGSAYDTFNEYMTWGVFSLYASDAFAADVSQAVTAATEAEMEERGFVRFSEFDRFLKAWYRDHLDDFNIDEMYRASLAWFEASTP